ncbi:MAG: zinc ribbon domain-containing protein [Anaerolineales bacterium]
MTVSSLIIVLVIFLLAGLLVVRPFLDADSGQMLSTAGRYDSLLAERERIYNAIESLDQDFEFQKISREEHDRGRQELLREAAVVLQKLEKHPGHSKKGKKASTLSAGDDDLERLIAERRNALQAARGELCPACGQPVAEDDQFCSNCGEKLA